MGRSARWENWISRLDQKACGACKDRYGKIYAIGDLPDNEPPLHRHCRCWTEPLQSLLPGSATNDGKDGADWWLAVYGKLPDCYLTKEEEAALGWDREKGNLNEVLPGRMIGGDIFKNKKGLLPDAPGRVWYEADINYTGGYRKKARVVYSNDGLIFVTYDHFSTFTEISVSL